MNKLAHSGGGREARAQGHWAEMRRKNTHTHLLSLKNNTHNLLNSLGQSLINPLKTPSELKRPKTSILIIASLSIRVAALVLIIVLHQKLSETETGYKHDE